MSYELMFKNAVALHEAGQFEQAENLYRQILETAPGQPDVLNLLGLIAQVKGAQNEAVSLFMQALKSKPNEVSYIYNLAFSFKLMKKDVEAKDCFLKVIQINPLIKEAFNEIALLFLQDNDLQMARKYWKNAIDLDARYYEARANMAFSYRIDNMGKAIEDLERLGQEASEEAIVFFYLAKLYMKKQLWDKAWTSAVKAKNLAPTSDEVRVLLGLLSCQENKVDNAKIYFTKAEILNPNNVAAIMGLADLYSRESNYAEAEKRYRRVIELDAKNFDTHNNYAEMLQKSGRLSEALEEYRAAVLINPTSAEVSNNLGVILRDLGEYDEALGLMFNALNLNPSLDEISVNIIETLTMLAYQDVDKASLIAKNWQKKYSDNVFAKKICAVLEGKNSEVDKVYSKKLFDNFADNYELVMQNLGYSIPMAMAGIVGYVQGRIVDLGCGTGLVGAVIKNDENYIIGVDISQNMLQEAAKKKVYDELVCADIVEYLEQNHDFDWVFAADVCGYISDINDIVKKLKNKKIVFSIEVTDEVLKCKTGISGRYMHNPEYIEKVLQQNGFDDICKHELVLRSEKGQPVKGMIFMAQ